MRRVYLKSQFNSAANPLVFVLDSLKLSRLDILRQTLGNQKGEQELPPRHATPRQANTTCT